MATAVRSKHRSVLASLILGAAVVAAVALVGWLLLLFVKGTVVLISYAVGIALIAVPLLLAHRLLSGSSGSERWRRLGTMGQVVVLGVALCVVAHLIGQHGWLLVVVPAAAVALARVSSAVGARRRQSSGREPDRPVAVR
jgi:hypothetical protein